MARGKHSKSASHKREVRESEQVQALKADLAQAKRKLADALIREEAFDRLNEENLRLQEDVQSGTSDAVRLLLAKVDKLEDLLADMELEFRKLQRNWENAVDVVIPYLREKGDAPEEVLVRFANLLEGVDFILVSHSHREKLPTSVIRLLEKKEQHAARQVRG